MRTRLLGLLTAAAMLFALPATSQATTLSFSGVFDSVSGSSAGFLGSLLGQTFAGSFTLTSPLNSSPGTSTSTIFELGASSFSVGSNSWTASNGILNQQFSGSNEVNLWSTNPGFGNSASFAGSTLTPLNLTVASAFFFAFGPDLFDDVAVLPDFSISDLTLAFYGLILSDGTQLEGSLTTLEVEILSATIPVPAALPLLIAALAGLGLVGARRRNATP